MFRLTEQRPADYNWSRQLAFLAARGIAAEVRIANGKSAVYREGEELIGREQSVEPERPKYAHRPGLPAR